MFVNFLKVCKLSSKFTEIKRHLPHLTLKNSKSLFLYSFFFHQIAKNQQKANSEIHR